MNASPSNRAYVVARIDVSDEAQYAHYVAAATPVISQFGGRVLARGGAYHALEGSARGRNVLIEFASLADAERYYHSLEYTAARALRADAAVAEFVAVEGIEPRNQEEAMSPVDMLLAIEQIKQVKARYCRIIDSKQWNRLAALFTPDARFDGFGSAPPGATREIFVDGVSRRLANVLSIHQVHIPEITLLDGDHARAIFPMQDYLEFPPDDAPLETPGSLGYIGFGHYEEEYRRQQGEWRIAYSRLSRLRIDPLPVDSLPRGADRLALLPDWLPLD